MSVTRNGVKLIARGDYPEEECLICEALVREIRDATRWSTMVEAWEALLQVRGVAKSLRKEQEHLRGSSQGVNAAPEEDGT
jgi:hypothetical protein